VVLAAAPALAGDVVGDEFFISMSRPPGFIGPQPAPFETNSATEYIVGLDAFAQLLVTTDPGDPNLDVALMKVSSENGQQRAHAIVLDFTGVVNAVINAGYPPDVLGNTAAWFDDIEEAVATPTQQIGNLLVLRVPDGGGAAVPGDPLRFPDGSGVSPAVPSDDLFNFDANGQARIPNFNGFGEGVVYTLTDWTALTTHPVIRIEFDLVAGPAPVPSMTEQGLMMIGLILVPAAAVYIRRRQRAVVVDQPDTWVM
jgi:hypothetical protein